ncbi:uncharacterized protein LACBIDRAFT_329224 [Laccaria bicolor S238N-H82]|uniref:Predicted protein n=1 Tax=Laccaria bicolor (strain S238N-H82 / ATCC MYA-4686) TaxID=486041 RepID=B0DHF4_LACBS|nr:uncharacterized protein LACBIDRAFT_329224 [Laccaria bicolor S238N-H82]EDR06009.1 predicted protein [Laccaria bicolor S238N-H82]|eukprot:XP_001883297.1 predicted protein [Laccaria bicolor S238N-H82]
MSNPHRNPATPASNWHLSPAQYESFEAPYTRTPVNLRSAGSDWRAFAKALTNYPILVILMPTGYNISRSASTDSNQALCNNYPIATTMYEGTLSRPGSTPPFVSASTSIEFWKAFFSNLATNTTDPLFYNARLLYDALQVVKEFPNGLPGFETRPIRGPADVQILMEEIMGLTRD